MNIVYTPTLPILSKICDFFTRLSKHKAVIIEPLIVNFGIFTVGLVTVSMANESIGMPISFREVVILNFYYLMPRLLWVLLVRIYFYNTERRKRDDRASIGHRVNRHSQAFERPNSSHGGRRGVCKYCSNVYDTAQNKERNGSVHDKHFHC